MSFPHFHGKLERGEGLWEKTTQEAQENRTALRPRDYGMADVMEIGLTRPSHDSYATAVPTGFDMRGMQCDAVTFQIPNVLTND